MNRHYPLAGLALAASVLLSACGGGSGAANDDPVVPRGTVVLGQLGGSATIAQIDAGTSSKGIQALSGTAKCGVDVHYVYYMTRDPNGNPATASTGVLVPSGTDASCTGQRPVLLYAHGTTTTKSFNMAQVTTNTEASLVMAFYAAQGFIVVAPNYMGYDRSGLNYTPYLNAESSAVDMVDGLRAAKSYLGANATTITTQPSAKLLIAGYSQGGHVALATQKVIERDYSSEFTISAVGGMSGPYNLAGFGDQIVGGEKGNIGATLFLPLMVTSYQKAYGNIYSAPTEIYQTQYAATAETLFPTDTSLADLMAAGKLPADSTFRTLFGTGGLLTDTFRAGYASSNFRKALVTNTLLDWAPKHPVALCGGANDPTVYFAINTTAAKANLSAQPKAATVTAYNVEDATTVGATVAGGFAQGKAATGAAAAAAYPNDPVAAATASATAIAGAYHGTLVPPFCNVVVRSYFQQVLAAGG
ncbi:Chlorophyllase [Roseateles sp. YR242]|uniref:alpha/beta hydrolase family protein n=1 Tax=Roseateles sp. YR242 TaxID=1855305 RepID=UPI0008C7D945|nr:hypothetical protein [Roseateles sp. YR242]SEL49784.1 Chlorophyllase [Roseateles sp. YR242]